VLVRALVVAAVLWLAAIILAPLAIASRLPGISLAATAVYAAGSRVCHQRPERCFWIHGRPMPVCARCSGLYGGAALGAPLALLAAAGIAAARARRLIVLAALPTAITWGIEMAGLAHPSNAVRAVAAVPLGALAAWLVVGAARAKRQEAHASRPDRPGPPSARGPG
jgi:uncharacterized membrane protein